MYVYELTPSFSQSFCHWRFFYLPYLLWSLFFAFSFFPLFFSSSAPAILFLSLSVVLYQNLSLFSFSQALFLWSLSLSASIFRIPFSFSLVRFLHYLSLSSSPHSTCFCHNPRLYISFNFIIFLSLSLYNFLSNVHLLILFLSLFPTVRERVLTFNL